MRVIPRNFAREAAALLVLGGILWCVPPAARGDDNTAAPVVARAIVLPALRAGGIAQGQVLQITEYGSEMVAPTRLALAATTPPATAAAALREAKVARGLFCAGSM